MHGDVPLGAQRLPPPADLGDSPGIWPLGTERRDGALAVGGIDVPDLATAHRHAGVRRRRRRLPRALSRCPPALPDADIYYAAKAFLSRGVPLGRGGGAALDVSTGGELEVALAAGFPPGRILFHGNNKSVDELRRAVEAGVGRVVLDTTTSSPGWPMADAAGVRQRVLIRVTVGVEAHTHEFIATAHEDQKFGFSLASGAAHEAARRVLALPALELVGLHSHIGSQIFDTAGFEVAAHRVAGLLERSATPSASTFPNSTSAAASASPTSPTTTRRTPYLAKQLRAIVQRECAAAGLPVPRLAVEPGRAIAGPAGITLYEVGTVKLTSTASAPTSASTAG